MQSYVKLIHRLSRLIKAKQLPYWLYDQDEGHLDPYLLTRIVASPSVQMSYVKEKITDFVPTLFYFMVDGTETEDLYAFIYDFALSMERSGAVVTEIPGVKGYKERIRGRQFDREKMHVSVFDYKMLSHIKYKRKVIINMTSVDVSMPLNRFNVLFKCEGIDEVEPLLNTMYDFFDKD